LIKQTHQLVVADNSHDRQGLDAVRAGVEGVPARLRARVAEHNIGMDVGIEIVNALVVLLHNVLEGSDGLIALVKVAPAVVTNTVLLAVAVDVHVCEVLAFALQVDDAVIGKVIATVVNSYEMK